MERNKGCICMTKQELIEDNMKLVYFVLHKYYPTYVNDEDIKQVGMVGLCKAANAWDGKSSKFSTYACTSIINELRNEFHNRSCTIPTISLESQLTNDDSDFELSKIVASDDVDFNSSIELNRFKRYLTKEELAILDYLANGLTQADIAKIYGVTKIAINYHVRRIRRKWREYNGNDKN